MAGNAGLFGGIGPVAAVNQAYAPQQQYLQQQQAARNAALQAIFKAILGALPSQQSVDAPYLAASQDTNNLARASAAGLQAANPDAQTQGGLRAIGAPASQQQQVGNIDNTAFNGNAALLQYTGGVIPSGVFNQDMQARNTYLASLPAILAGYAKQGVGQLAGIADKENMGLAQDRASALMKARTDLANFVQQNQSAKATAAYRNAQLGIQGRKLADSEQNTAFTQKFKTTQLNDQNFWKGQSLSLQAKKFAQQTISQDRNYQLALKRVGISERGLQLRIATAAYTQAHGGYSAAKIAGFNTKMDALLAGAGAPTKSVNGVMPTKTYFDKNGKPIKLGPDGSVPPGVKVSSVKNANTYGSFIAAALKKGVPIQLAIQRANTIWPETQREDLGSLASLPAIAKQAAQQTNDYQVATGRMPSRADTPAKQSLQDYAFSKFKALGWTAQDASALQQLWNGESGWNPDALNKSSGAAGIPQALGHTLPPDYRTNPQSQINWGIDYIKGRYRTPTRAWAFWNATVHKQASLAPADLQPTARMWISKGYAGY